MLKPTEGSQVESYQCILTLATLIDSQFLHWINWVLFSDKLEVQRLLFSKRILPRRVFGSGANTPIMDHGSLLLS